MKAENRRVGPRDLKMGFCWLEHGRSASSEQRNVTREKVREVTLPRSGTVSWTMVRLLYFILDDKGNPWKIWAGMIRAG